MSNFVDSIRNIIRIGLLSDTHIPEVAKVLPPQIKEAFHDVDLILHAGDVYAISVLDELERLAPVLAAQGDDDGFAIASDRRMKERHLLNIKGITILLKHVGPWSSLCDSKGVSGLAGSQHKTTAQHKMTPDIIVYGHTHTAKVENRNGILAVNPGSPTFPEYELRLGTVALLTVNSGKAEANLVQLE